MLDRTTTAASERSEQGRANVASVSGPGVMLTGVMLEKMPRWATEDAGKGGRRRGSRAPGQWLIRGLWLVPVAILVYLSRGQLDLAKFPDRSVLVVPQAGRRYDGDQARSTTSSTGSSTRSTRSRWR